LGRAARRWLSPARAPHSRRAIRAALPRDHPAQWPQILRPRETVASALDARNPAIHPRRRVRARTEHQAVNTPGDRCAFSSFAPLLPPAGAGVPFPVAHRHPNRSGDLSRTSAPRPASASHHHADGRRPSSRVDKLPARLRLIPHIDLLRSSSRGIPAAQRCPRRYVIGIDPESVVTHSRPESTGPAHDSGRSRSGMIGGMIGEVVEVLLTPPRRTTHRMMKMSIAAAERKQQRPANVETSRLRFCAAGRELAMGTGGFTTRRGVEFCFSRATAGGAGSTRSAAGCGGEVRSSEGGGRSS
jgi:hypothetical protein